MPYFQISVTLKELGLDNPSGYHIEDLYDDHVYGIVTPDRRFKVDVNPSGSKSLSSPLAVASSIASCVMISLF